MDVFQRIAQAIQSAQKIVITSHKGPDGDSVGCSLGLYHFLKKVDKEVTVCHPDRAPEFLQWVPGYDSVLFFDEMTELVTAHLIEADLIFVLDYNSPERVGLEMQHVLINSSATKIMIDHHPHPADFCYIMFSDSSFCSTSQMIYEVIDRSVNRSLLDATIGTPLYLGIMTDTGSFRFPSVTPRTHEVLAELMKNGVVHSDIHEKIYDSNTLERLQLRGYAIAEKFERINDYPVAIISLNVAELTRFHYKKGDTEGLVNSALSVEGIKAAAFFLERENEIKISFRSKGDYFVNELAMNEFSGGGHKYAAGGVSTDTLENTLSKFRSLVSKYFSR
ncbi:MAG: bifunctional oligoribonuclease/PAP phosphatase NrnA [Cryomorphaceae bacterium]|jgi:phosphoesterase RecJ-like protein|nr:bifunctional oligoribonuclease/PAP phosphatase NrnA [Cryomorphaceae bacterium]